ncbi:Methyltransferase [Lachnospiraceae bacterium TWA4]|nr:Methyltransferase [Lachnospiraceae bacterium TWA4]
MTSESYTSFASVYDVFMDNVPYEEWCEYLVGLLHTYGCEEGLVADLGCGTGKLTSLLSSKGYDMIGIDNSWDMLDIAKEHNKSDEILYLLQDMREFELYGTVKAVVSICDSMNYILEEEDLIQVFRLVNNYLDPKGIFIFDCNTISKYMEIGDSVIAENRDEGSFIWENEYNEDDQLNIYDLTLFIKDKKQDVYHKYQETHYQRAYTIEQIKYCLDVAGLEFVAVYDAFTTNPPTKDSERIYFIARERGK